MPSRNDIFNTSALQTEVINLHEHNVALQRELTDLKKERLHWKDTERKLLTLESSTTNINQTLRAMEAEVSRLRRQNEDLEHRLEIEVTEGIEARQRWKEHEAHLLSALRAEKDRVRVLREEAEAIIKQIAAAGDTESISDQVDMFVGGGQSKNVQWSRTAVLDDFDDDMDEDDPQLLRDSVPREPPRQSGTIMSSDNSEVDKLNAHITDLNRIIETQQHNIEELQHSLWSLMDEMEQLRGEADNSNDNNHNSFGVMDTECIDMQASTTTTKPELSTPKITTFAKFGTSFPLSPPLSPPMNGGFFGSPKPFKAYNKETTLATGSLSLADELNRHACAVEEEDFVTLELVGTTDSNIDDWGGCTAADLLSTPLDGVHDRDHDMNGDCDSDAGDSDDRMGAVRTTVYKGRLAEMGLSTDGDRAALKKRYQRAMAKRKKKAQIRKEKELKAAQDEALQARAFAEAKEQELSILLKRMMGMFRGDDIEADSAAKVRAHNKRRMTSTAATAFSTRRV
ncbi:hypothetical protein HDU76_002455 [Blyttiomyces sp. JEL0837]|nr:hypothetical protein HDU76_002455 [Blyttiomyces sp. JEL0837]